MLKLGLGAHSVPTIIGSGDSGERQDGGDTPLLDAYSGAVAAYSVRKLRSGYSGSALRVRRDSDNTEQDIGFDSNGNLDTAAISTFCGSATGYVSVWYDQTTSINDASQNNTAKQPQIYNGTAVITNGNSNTSLYFDSTHTLTNSTVLANDPAYTTFVSQNISSHDPRVFMLSNEKTYSIEHRSIIRMRYGDGSNGTDFTTGSTMNGLVINNNVALVTGYKVNDSANLFANGAAASSNPSTLDYDSSGSIIVHAQGPNKKLYVSEIIHYSSDQSSNRTAIESNINQHYSIYPEVFEHTSGLLYDYPNAAAAYSVRQLGDGAMFAMRIRRDTDNEEINIGFDSNGNLDTAAIASFCGASVGKLVKLYDQTVNESNHRWPSAHTQPNVYDGTSVYTEGGNPAIYFTSNTDRSIYHDNNLSFNIQDMGMYAVSKNEVGYGHRVLAYLPTTAGNIQLRYPNTNLNYVSYPGATSVAFPSSLIDHEITSFYADSASSEMKGFANDLEVSSGSASNTVLAEGITIAGSTSNSTDFQGTFQELLVYGVSTKAVHNDLVSDINSHYLTYPDVTAHTSGLLYDYPDAAAAYSVRQLGDGATHCMRVRRDSDNAETNIGFDSNGDLDTTAISSFCGSANGFVSVWYDQSTSGNDAAQITPANQPQIYNGTSVITENGKPAIDLFRTSGSVGSALVVSSTIWSTSGDASTFAVGLAGSVGDAYLWDTVGFRLFYPSGALRAMFYGSSGNTDLTGSSVSGQGLYACNKDGLNSELFINGSSVASSSSTFDIYTDSRNACIGARFNGTEGFSSGYIQELIHYPTERTDELSGIDTSINGYFSIY